MADAHLPDGRWGIAGGGGAEGSPTCSLSSTSLNLEVGGCVEGWTGLTTTASPTTPQLCPQMVCSCEWHVSA